MSNYLSLLPLSLDAGSPSETDRAVVPEARPQAPHSPPIPPAWLEPQPEPAKKPRIAQVIFVALLALSLAWDYFTPPAAHEATTTTQDGACPAE